MPLDAIMQVGNLGQQEGMPKTLTFADRYNFEIPDDDDAIDNNHNSDYDPAKDDASTASRTSSYSSHSGDFDDDDNDDEDWDDNIAQPYWA
jgi:hypothetical protein